MSASLRFDDLKVLEIGATGKSTLSPFLVARGADATVTCYLESELSPLQDAISRAAKQYCLPTARFHVNRADILALNPESKFDLILLKGVLGGISRRHEIYVFQKAADNCLSILNPNGRLLIIDKGRSFWTVNWMLRHFGAAGRRGWHYFTLNELTPIITPKGFIAHFAASGIIDFADFGGGVLEKTADFLDKYFLEKFVPAKHRVVFSITCGKREDRPNDSFLTQ